MQYTSQRKTYHIKKLKSDLKGFTLVELLVAIFVFSLLSGFAYRSLSMLLELDEMSKVEVKALSDAQRAHALWQRDLLGSAGIDASSESLIEPPVVAVLKNKAATDIQYSLEEEVLYRAVGDEASGKTALLRDVLSVELVQHAAATKSDDNGLHRIGVNLAFEHRLLGQVTWVGEGYAAMDLERVGDYSDMAGALKEPSASDQSPASPGSGTNVNNMDEMLPASMQNQQ